MMLGHRLVTTSALERASRRVASFLVFLCVLTW